MSDEKIAFKDAFRRRCFDFSIAIIKLSESIAKSSANKVILDQLLRSATSIGANVYEGGSSISKKEFISYFQISLKSASETIYWLLLLKETNDNFSTKIDLLITECTELKKLLTSILIRTKSN